MGCINKILTALLFRECVKFTVPVVKFNHDLLFKGGGAQQDKVEFLFGTIIFHHPLMTSKLFKVGNDTKTHFTECSINSCVRQKPVGHVQTCPNEKYQHTSMHKDLTANLKFYNFIPFLGLHLELLNNIYDLQCKGLLCQFSRKL